MNTDELYDEDSYSDFMTSTAIRQRVMSFISSLPLDERDAVRDKVLVLYKMGVSWRGIKLAIIGGAYGSEDRCNAST